MRRSQRNDHESKHIKFECRFVYSLPDFTYKERRCRSDYTILSDNNCNPIRFKILPGHGSAYTNLWLNRNTKIFEQGFVI